jgi:hypothetical protein
MLSLNFSGGTLMRTRLVFAAGGAAIVLAAAGCGGSSSSGAGQSKPVNPNAKESLPPGDIPDNQAYVAYALPGAHVSVKVPEGWARSASGHAVTFTDKLNSVRMEVAPAAAPLTAATAKSTGVARLRASVHGLQGAKVDTVVRPAGRVVRIRYLADSAPDPVTGKVATDAVQRYYFFRNGRQLVLTLTGAKAADNVDPWKIVTKSVRWTA